MRRILNFVGFYIGWFACVVGAARGMPVVGPLVVATVLALHLVLSPQPQRDARLILAVGVLGFAVDTLQAALGVFTFSVGALAPWVSPPWLVSIWMLFASTLYLSFGWLSGRYLLAAAIGGVTGPLSYAYGARLGAITLHPHVTLSLAALVVVWALTVPFLLWLAERMAGAPQPQGVPIAERA